MRSDLDHAPRSNVLADELPALAELRRVISCQRVRIDLNWLGALRETVLVLALVMVSETGPHLFQSFQKLGVLRAEQERSEATS